MKHLGQFKELNQIAQAMTQEAWGALLVQGILGDPDWFHDMVDEAMDELSKFNPQWFGEYHGVFSQFGEDELLTAKDQYSEYIKPWIDMVEERIENSYPIELYDEEFINWVGGNYIRMHGGWIAQYADQRSLKNLHSLPHLKEVYNKIIKLMAQKKGVTP